LRPLRLGEEKRKTKEETVQRVWANVQRDGGPAEYRWRLLFNRSVWLTPTTRAPCSNAAKTRNPLKLAGVPQTRPQISAVSRPKFTILRGHVEEILLFNNFFRLSTSALVATIWPDKVVRWCRYSDFLRHVFPASRLQHISDLDSKFALRPHHVSKYSRHPICGR